MTATRLEDQSMPSDDMVLTEPGLTFAAALAVVEPDPAAANRIAEPLSHLLELVVCPSTQALLEVAGAAMPDLVVFGPSFGDREALRGLRLLAKACPSLTIVLVVEAVTADLAEVAATSGVADVMTLEELVEQVESVAKGPEKAEPSPHPETPPACRVITVVSPKGGAGKSVVATNLAVVLAGKSDRPVCLVDADLQFGDDAVMLMVTASFTVADAVHYGGTLDRERLEGIIVRHQPSGLLVLPAPTEPWSADEISADDLLRIIDLLRQACSHVVVDTSSHFGEVVLRLLEASEEIVFVASTDLPNIKTAKVGLRTLRALGIPEDRVRLVLNRATGIMPMDLPTVQEAVGARADETIPNDDAIMHAVNKGAPVVLSSPKSGAAKSLKRLGELVFAAAPAGAASSRG